MRTTATIHQLQLTSEEVHHLNSVGREAAHKEPKFKAYDDVRSLGSGYIPEYWQYYEQQGDIEIEFRPQEVDSVLENIFAAGNDNGYGPIGKDYHRYEHAFSISVGDIIKIGESMWIVDNAGFTKVEARN